MRYDDMAGLDMYDGMDGLEAYLNPQMLQEYLMAAGAGAGAILLGTWLMPKLPAPTSAMFTDNAGLNAHRMRAGLATVGGVALGAFLLRYNRDLGFAVMGGVAGLGLAQIIDSFVDANFVGTPFGQLSADGDDMSGLSGDEDSSMALATLESANVGAARPAFGDPSITREKLQGFDAAMVQSETLGGYQPWLS